MCKTILVRRVNEKMCYFHFKAICWWGNDTNMPSLLPKGKLFHMLQDVTALCTVPSVCEWHHPKVGLYSITCFICLYLGLVCLHHLVLREVIEVSSWHLESEVPSHPERIFLKALLGHLEVDVANGCVWVKRTTIYLAGGRC